MYYSILNSIMSESMTQIPEEVMPQQNLSNEQNSESLNNEANCVVVFISRYNMIPRPNIENIKNLFSKYGTVSQVMCPQNANIALVSMCNLVELANNSLNNVSEYRSNDINTKVYNIINDIIINMNPNAKFHVSIAKTNQYRKNKNMNNSGSGRFYNNYNKHKFPQYMNNRYYPTMPMQMNPMNPMAPMHPITQIQPIRSLQPQYTENIQQHNSHQFLNPNLKKPLESTYKYPTQISNNRSPSQNYMGQVNNSPTMHETDNNNQFPPNQTYRYSNRYINRPNSNFNSNTNANFNPNTGGVPNNNDSFHRSRLYQKNLNSEY